MNMYLMMVYRHQKGCYKIYPLRRWIQRDEHFPVNMKDKIFLQGIGKNTGLGLFLVREILSITGISITEDGIPGKGCRFIIRVPAGSYVVKKP